MPKKPVLAASDIVLEIQCEELPATNLAELFESSDNALEQRLMTVFKDFRIDYSACRVFATPRRLVFWVKGAADRQSKKDNLIKLLARQEGYDAAGNPTEKLLTILKHRQSDIRETVISDLNGREFVFIKKEETARRTEAVLPELF
jgi:glycyl-tRNA synthetase beta chain